MQYPVPLRIEKDNLSKDSISILIQLYHSSLFTKDSSIYYKPISKRKMSELEEKGETADILKECF